MRDYRVIGDNNPFNDIEIKKKKLQETLKTDHPRAKNHCNLISNKISKHNKEFASIYGERCSYCGIDYSIKNCENFEVDHFICKASGKADVDCLSNLVYTCDYCNKKKGSFKISEEDSKILNPDQELGKTFYRDKVFYIKISETHKNNNLVKSFYSKMNFDYQRRRIEYLILAINNLISTIQNKDIECHFSKISEKLRNKYNRGLLVENIRKTQK